VAQPPQPLVDGRLGVPANAGSTAWQVPTVSLFDTVTDPAVNIARDSLSDSQVLQLSEAGAALPQGPADVMTLDLAAQGEGRLQPEPPPSQPEPPPRQLQPQYPIPGQPPGMGRPAPAQVGQANPQQ